MLSSQARTGKNSTETSSSIECDLQSHRQSDRNSLSQVRDKIVVLADRVLAELDTFHILHPI